MRTYSLVSQSTWAVSKEARIEIPLRSNFLYVFLLSRNNHVVLLGEAAGGSQLIIFLLKVMIVNLFEFLLIANYFSSVNEEKYKLLLSNVVTAGLHHF